MGLDVTLTQVLPVAVYSGGITHNMSRMANEAGIYEPLWAPAESGVTKAHDLIEPLTKGLELLKSDPERFKAYNPANGWGSYEEFVRWLTEYLAACTLYPDADVSADM
jgi:hypothetical protein